MKLNILYKVYVRLIIILYEALDWAVNISSISDTK